MNLNTAGHGLPVSPAAAPPRLKDAGSLISEIVRRIKALTFERWIAVRCNWNVSEELRFDATLQLPRQPTMLFEPDSLVPFRAISTVRDFGPIARYRAGQEPDLAGADRCAERPGE